LKPGGWGWIAPWNGLGKRQHDPVQVQEILARQADAFVECGWSAFHLDDDLARHYGVSGAVANHALFIKNLRMPPAIANVKARLASFKTRVADVFLR
jgi:hypothetical protein